MDIPVRMCAVVELPNGLYQPFCIACGWRSGIEFHVKEGAERSARRHSCRTLGDR